MAVVFIAGGLACTTSQPTKLASEDESQDTVVTIDKVTAQVFSGEECTATITAAKGKLNITTGKARLEGVTIQFTTAEFTTVPMQIECSGESADMYIKDNPLEGYSSNDMDIEGDVTLTQIAEGDPPLTLWSSNLRYNAGDDERTYVCEGVGFDLEMLDGENSTIRMEGLRFSASRDLSSITYGGEKSSFALEAMEETKGESEE